MIKRIKENYKELLLIFILYSSYLKNNRKLKNPTLVNILQEYHVPHSHTCSEHSEDYSFQAEYAHDFAVLSKLDEICHFGLEIQLSVND